MDARERGERGERIAAAYLQEQGWTILARNQRVGRRELDLIVQRGEILAFVEVKSRGGTGFGAPLEAVNPKKRMEVSRAAAEWLLTKPIPAGTVIRFDAIGVTWDPRGRYAIRHVEDAWHRE